jgi:hypothetical protein
MTFRGEMTSSALQHPSSYLQQQQQQHHQHPTMKQEPGGIDDRSTSPTVVVTTNQTIKEGVHDPIIINNHHNHHYNMSPMATASTAPNSATSTPVSTTGYSSVPNPAKAYAMPEQPHHHPHHDSIIPPPPPGTYHYYQQHHVTIADPLGSPRSVPNHVGTGWSSAPVSTNNTPVPSEINTQMNAHASNGGPPPYFPSMKNSVSSSSLSSKTSTKSVQVAGKKKHQTKTKNQVIRVSSSSSSLNMKDIGEGEETTTGTGGVVTVRRQKRLQRNRESARLSRRRRKQYLEVLEERVTHLSLDMDRGRRDHAAQAVETVSKQRRHILLQQHEQGTTTVDGSDPRFQHDLDHRLWLLDGPLSRTSHKLMILSTFFTQQLKSFSLPSHTKFVLWLSLQGDKYFRGGRASSERLSAARIGERVRAKYEECR